MTSSSRSDKNDEAPEATGAVAPEQLEGASASSAPRRPASKAAKKPASSAKKPASTASSAKSSVSAARSAAAKKAAATRAANRAAAAEAAAAAAEAERAASAPEAAAAATETTKPDAATQRDAATAADPVRQPASRRTATSRAAAAKAATARGEAAKAARRPQRIAAAITTETTAAERPRKTTDASEEAAMTDTPAVVPEPAPVAPPPPPVLPTAAAEFAVVEAAESIVNDEVTAAEVEPAEPIANDEVEPAEVAEETQERVPASDAPADEASTAVETETAQTADATEQAAPSERESDVAVAVIPTRGKKAARKKRTLRVARIAPPESAERVLLVDGLVKRFGDNVAVDHISLEVRAGSFFGVVGPNGAGKTTTLSMVTGLLRPDEGTVRIHGIDAWADPVAAKRATGVLPDRLRLFDRLTGAQLLHYSGVLRGLDGRTVRERSAALIAAFGLDDAVDRLVVDYSAGMTKKIALACAMIHSPRILVLDEPFESVDPVSAANLTEILETYVAGGGTVVLSSHGMDLIERVCDSVAIVVGGRVLSAGTLDEVRQGETLEDRFVELAGGRKAAEGMEWLHSFSD